MQYKFDNETNENKIRFSNLCEGEIFRLGSTLYIKTPEIETCDEDYDDWHYFNSVDLKYGAHRYIDKDDAIERFDGEITFREDDFQTSWKVEARKGGN